MQKQHAIKQQQICISFANSTKQARIGALQLNTYINIRLKYESLDNVEVLDKAVFTEKSQTFAEGLLDVKKNGIPLFLGVEQGLRKNQTSTHVYFKPNMAM